MWEHESIRSKWQDGECVSLTVRIKSIDSYYGSSSPYPLLAFLITGDDISSTAYARLKQHERIKNSYLRNVNE
jgi:hypothetical protein